MKYFLLSIGMSMACIAASAQTATQQAPAPPQSSQQADAQRLLESSFEIQAELHAMKKYELSLKALRKIDEAYGTVRRMRAVPAPNSPR